MRNHALLIGDLFIIVACVLGSFLLKLNSGARLSDSVVQIQVMTGISLILKPLLYCQFELYKRVWAYRNRRTGTSGKSGVKGSDHRVVGRSSNWGYC